MGGQESGLRRLRPPRPRVKEWDLHRGWDTGCNGLSSPLLGTAHLATTRGSMARVLAFPACRPQAILVLYFPSLRHFVTAAEKGYEGVFHALKAMLQTRRAHRSQGTGTETHWCEPPPAGDQEPLSPHPPSPPARKLTSLPRAEDLPKPGQKRKEKDGVGEAPALAPGLHQGRPKHPRAKTRHTSKRRPRHAVLDRLRDRRQCHKDL